MPNSQQTTTRHAVVSILAKAPRSVPIRDNSSLPMKPWRVRYGAAVIGIVLMTLLRFALEPILKGHAPFITYIAAMAFSAWIGGLGPGLLSVFLGTLAGWLFFIPPTFQFAVHKPIDPPTLILLILVGASISIMGELQLRAQGRAAEASRRIAGVLESITDGFVALDREWHFIYVNSAAERINGISREVMLGKSVWEMFPDIAATRLADACRHAARARSPMELETYYSARQKWYDFRLFPTQDGGMAVYFRDVTERRRYSTDIQERQAEIAALNERLHRAVYESCHRIKNHLQTLAATVDMALMDGEERIPADEVRRLGTQIRTLSVLQDLLTLEWKSDKSTAVETVSSRMLLASVLEMLREATRTENMDFEIADVPLSVRTASSLGLMVNEAVTNAVKHGKSRVAVTFQVNDCIGVLKVCDDGPGFPPDFDPVTSANTGLELISSLVVHDLNGAVTYENRAKGGACVCVTFAVPAQE